MAKSKTNNNRRKPKSRAQKQVTFSNAPSNLNTARTLNQVEMALRKPRNKTARKPQKQSDWVACRLSPWSGPHGNDSLLPDGTSIARNQFDMYSYTDFSLQNTGDIDLMIFAAMPFNSAIKVGTGSGSLYINNNFGTGAPASTTPPTAPSAPCPVVLPTAANPNVWIPLNYTQSVVSWLDNFQVMNPEAFGDATKVRTISLGWRLSYLGPASTCQGLVTAVSSPMRCEPTVIKQAGRVNFQTGANGSVVTPFTCATTAPMKILPLDLNFFTNKTVASARVETNPHGILRHSTNNFRFVDYNDLATVVVDIGTVATTNYVQDSVNAMFAAAWNNAAGSTQTAPQTFSSIATFEEDWESTYIRVAAAKGSYRLETWHCIEVVPESDSPYYTLAHTPKTAQPAIIAATEQKVASAPVMQTDATKA